MPTATGGASARLRAVLAHTGPAWVAAAAASRQEGSPRSPSADLELFIRALREMHPATTRYTPPEEMDRLFEDARATVNDGTTLCELEAVLETIVCRVGCGHTRLQPGQEEQGRRLTELLCLPLSVRFVDERAYVLADLGGGEIPPGSEILELDGKPMADVLEALLERITGDGSIRTGRIDTLNGTANPDNPTGSFPERYALLCGSSGREQYAVRYLPPGGAGLHDQRPAPQATVAGQPLSAWAEYKSEESDEAPLLELTHPAPNVGLLRVGSFWHKGWEEPSWEEGGYAQFMAASFQELADRRTEALIIDVRQNGGGTDTFGSMLLGYLLDEPFTCELPASHSLARKCTARL